jgi:hypothetical protein
MISRRRDDALGFAERFATSGFPGLFEPGDAQVRHRKTRETGFGLRAATGRAFVADLPPDPVAAPGNGEIAVG